MKLVLEDFMAKIRELEGKMSAVESNQVVLQKELLGKSILCKSLELQLKSTQEKLDYANLQLFGDRCQKLRSKTPKGESKKTDSNRQKEKDDYDGTDDMLCTDSVGHNQSREVKELFREERDLSNRLDGYKTMGVVGEAIEHPSDLAKVPDRIIERRMIRVFSLCTFLVEECFEMVHYAELGKKPKWGYFKNIFNGCRDYVNMVLDKITLATRMLKSKRINKQYSV